MDILDSVTLQTLQTLKFGRVFENFRSALSFSPDGRMLTCFGRYDDDGFVPEVLVVTWDLQTGGVIKTIRRRLGIFYLDQTCITYSTNGKAVGVLHQGNDTTISIYNVVSDVYTPDVYHLASDTSTFPREILRLPGYNHLPWSAIWTHGESLRFAIAAPTAAIVWEVGPDLGATPTEVGSLSLPDARHGVQDVQDVQFLPTLHRLAILGRRKGLARVLVWDAQESRSLLHCTDISFSLPMKFSSDGRSFACPTKTFEVYLWKESSTGYVLHAILTPGTPDITPLLSPKGEFLFTYGHFATQLWHTKSSTTGSSSSLLQARRNMNFVLELLPDRSLAVVARQKDDTVTVLDLKSGVPQWTIDVGMEVYGLRAIGETIVVIGEEKVITWNLPEGIVSPGAMVGLEYSVRLIGFFKGESPVVAASISSDFAYTAVLSGEDTISRTLTIYETSTGKDTNLFTYSSGNTLWFLPDGFGVGWVADGNRGKAAKFTQGGLALPESIGDIEYGQCGCPHGSSSGYKVTNDGWIISPSRKRLLMLPPQWRAETERRVWNGKFLGLLQSALPEAVILELEPPPVAL